MKIAAMFNIVVVIIASALIGCAQAGDSARDKANQEPYQLNYPRVSIIQLLSNPDGYDEKKISVGGYLVSDTHWSPLIIYAHKDYYLSRLNENSINVDIDISRKSNISAEYIKSVSGNYGIVSGIFHSSRNGESIYLYMDEVYQIQVKKLID